MKMNKSKYFPIHSLTGRHESSQSTVRQTKAQKEKQLPQVTQLGVQSPGSSSSRPDHVYLPSSRVYRDRLLLAHTGAMFPGPS